MKIALIVLISVLLLGIVTSYEQTIPAPTLEEKIFQQAQEAGINPHEALAVLRCESNLDPLAQNAHSTAKGLGQFLDSTWANYCEGDVLNEDDNLRCFIKYYPIYPTWWECYTNLYG